MLALGPVVIRLHGTDTSEEGQRGELAGGGIWACRATAMAWVDVLATDRKLACLARHVDLYERVVEGGAVVGRVDGVGTVLARKEPDWAFLAYSDASVYQEASAETAGPPSGRLRPERSGMTARTAGSGPLRRRSARDD